MMPSLSIVENRAMWQRWLIGACLFLGNISWVGAQSPRFVELVESDKPYQGKVVARSKDHVWLMERNGAMHTLGVGNISRFRKLSDAFSPISSADLRDQLRRELGGGFDIVGTGHYLVAGPPGLVRNYAEIFEDQYRAIYAYFSVRGLEVRAPEFPLVAIVFPDPASFAKYALKDQLVAGAGLKGYYIQSTNRVALFHENSTKTSSLPSRMNVPRLTGSRLLPTSDRPGLISDRLLQNEAWGNTEGDLQATVIHETTHQVAFNIGIHSRVGNVNPRWVVEGLATTFEAPGMRSSSLANTPGAKLNPLRLSGFREFVKQRRKAKSLEGFVKSDLVFGENLLDGYAQAWALSYYLIETRPREYAKFIKLIAARPPLEPYEDEQRLADFKSAFGSDLVLLEAKFLRYIAEAK